VNANRTISRRVFAGGLALLGLDVRAHAQGFAGLSENAADYAQVKPGKAFNFPADHGPHPDFRIEWWYVTANLKDSSGNAFGAQWTLFRQALAPGTRTQQEGWANQQIWMAHAAVTRTDTHRFNQTYARGGIGQAGVTAEPFAAWIDSWAMRGGGTFDANNVSPLELTASAENFSYALQLASDHPLALQGDGGYSRKSLREQASYYYSQPFFKAKGRLTIDDKPVDVSGVAWMDREWSSQPLAPDQKGWDWFALHFASGEKLMLYRMRESDGNHYVSGNWIVPDGPTRPLGPDDIKMTPGAPVDIDGHRLPVAWRISIPSLALSIESTALNERAWMGTSFAYWEGPISFKGSHSGVGYLEMTGY
jgi:predicted secreted hydrolase